MSNEANSNLISQVLSGRASSYDKTTVVVAAILAILIHLLLFIALPKKFQYEIKNFDEFKELEIDIIPPEVEKLLPQFIEANPDANNDNPDKKTNLESFQNQKAAQENPVLNSNDDTPKTDGKVDSQKIVSGDSSEVLMQSNPQDAFEVLNRPLENSNPKVENKTQDLQKQNEENQTQTKEILDALKSIAKDKESASPINENLDSKDPIKIAEKKDTEFKEKQSQEQTPPTLDELVGRVLPSPKARPRISMKTPAGPIRQSNTDANAIGALAVNSKFSEFGAYQQRMIEAVSRQWYLLGSRYDLASSRKTNVIIEFKLNMKGEITSFKTIFNSSTQTGKSLCEQAILSTAPYGEWSEEMVTTFGSQDQTVTFSFYY